jgi:hypothetical protein
VWEVPFPRNGLGTIGRSNVVIRLEGKEKNTSNRLFDVLLWEVFWLV